MARAGDPNTVFEYFLAEYAPEPPDDPLPGTTANDADTEVIIETLF